MGRSNRSNCYSFGMAAKLFSASKSLVSKFRYDFIAEEVAVIENCAFEYMCGTDNVNIEDYLWRYYRDEISIDELLDAIAYPNEKDVTSDE